jgi:hypothetical protein
MVDHTRHNLLKSLCIPGAPIERNRTNAFKRTIRKSSLHAIRNRSGHVSGGSDVVGGIDAVSLRESHHGTD